MKRRRSPALVPDETEAILWAPWRMLESDHDAFLTELSALEKLLKLHGASPNGSAQVLRRVERFIHDFEAHMASHFKAEEKAVFPYLRRHAPKLTATLLRLTGEHRLIQQTMSAWKHTFKKVRLHGSAKTVRAVSCRQGLKLVRLLRAHVTKETRLMHRYSSAYPIPLSAA